MLKNFFKTALRNIRKHKAYSIINFLGLTCGLGLALLIFSYVRSETSFDTFHSKLDRLYRIKYVAPNGLQIASSPPPIAPLMKDYFPEVEEACRMYARNVTISLPESQQSFEETRVFFADSSITRLFTFQTIRGDMRHALQQKFTVVITDEMAKKYFGDKDPIGETLIFQGNQSFKVIAVVNKFPENSHIQFNMLVPYDNMFDLETPATATALRNNLSVNFIISHSYTYVLLKSGADPSNVDKNMPGFLKKYARPDLLVGQVFTLMPVKDIHLKSELLMEPTNTNSETNLLIFIGVGLLTLIIACINYINLSTAQSLTRIKEIGIRKILGSMKYQLIGQFLAESFLFSFIALLLSLVVFYFALPFLNDLTNKSLEFAQELDATLIISALILVVTITMLAGGYPSYFVTQFNSINALKGNGSLNAGSQFLRRALVVVQLTIACMLLSGSLMIVKQLRFLTTRPLGFQKDHVINVPLFSQNFNGIFRQNDSTFWIRLQSFRDAVETQSNIKATTLSSNPPGLGVVFRGTIPEGFTQQDNLFLANFSVDYDFMKTYGMDLVAGRSFSKENRTDEAEAFIVNETAVREWKWESPEKAIGKSLIREGKKGKVIGVVRDFNFTSLTTPVSAMVIEVNPNQFNTLSIKFENENVQPTIEELRRQWDKMFPEKSFQFSFLDQQLNNQYQNFRDFGSIIQTFTFIAIVISCLGVYGLVLFVVQRKVKEIGVRKVLGASVGGILKLIYTDFAWLLVLGFVLAVPLSYFLLSQWLENFTYHTSIDIGTYLLSFLIVFLIVVLTIAYQAVKASLANPVKSLRTE